MGAGGGLMGTAFVGDDSVLCLCFVDICSIPGTIGI